MIEAPTEEVLERTRVQMLARLEKVAQDALLEALAKVLGKGDLIMLTALGIDGRQKMLDIFIERCQQLKKEIENE